MHLEKVMGDLSKHRSVLTEELRQFIKPRQRGRYLDATFGGGGHTMMLLEASRPLGKVVAIDRDPEVEKFTLDLKKEYHSRFEFYPISFIDLDTIEGQFDAIVFDLGLSTDQLEDQDRGFSFSNEALLDMRFNQSHGQNAAQLLKNASAQSLQKIFSEYGQDRYSKTLARKIIESRREAPIQTNSQLIKLIGTNNPKVLAPIFQALRIAVNDELNQLQQGLEQAYQKLLKDGLLAVISFHSVEDRVVKNFINQNSMEKITKKPLVANENEVRNNPKARSAKLRVARKVII